VKTHLFAAISWRQSLCLAIACLTFALSPSYIACGSEDTGDDFAFDQEDMQIEIQGDWSGTVVLTDEESVSFSLNLSQATQTEADSTVRQSLCGTRSFFQEASACVAVSKMAITGTLTSEDTTESVLGLFSIYGGTLDNGDLRFTTNNGTTYATSFRIGEFHDGTISRGPENLGTFALHR
jgi:hypothetical protein